MKLTIRTIATITPDPTRDIVVWDDELAGFGLRMKPSGVASFMVQYRNRDGVSRRVTIGRVGVLTPEEARKLAREKLGEVTKGGDPANAKKEARDAMTVAEVCEWYLDQASKGALLGRRGARIKDGTLYQDRSRINTHVLPLIGARKVESLTLDDIEKFQAEIAAGKTAKDRRGRGGETTGGTGAASRCVGMLRTILGHATRKKLIKGNPATGVQKYADGRQRRFLTLDEIATLGDEMRDAEKAGESRTGLTAIRFLLLTGLRRMEALALPWAWVDGRARCIRFEDSKSGAQLRPIGAEAVKLLDGLHRREGSPWVFQADRGDGHYIGAPKVLERVCRRACLDGVTVHVLRHSFAATAAEMGYSELTIAGLIGHSVASVTARYAHVPDRALVSAADAVSARIAAALDGEKAGGQVVEFRRAQGEESQ